MASTEFSESVLNFQKLNKDNFKSWKFNMKMYLLSQGLFGFIDATEPEPAAGASEAKRRTYKTRQAKALSIIYLSIEEELKSLVMEEETQVTVWKEISDVFQPTTSARIPASRKEFISMKFTPPEMMTMYAGRLFGAAKDLELAGEIISDDEIAYQLLYQLPDNYDNVVMQLYQLSDEKFTSQAVRQALIAEYDRLQHKNTSSQMGTSAFSSTRANYKKRQNASTKPKKETRTCYGCGIVGQLLRNCWKTRKRTSRKMSEEHNSKNNTAEAFFSSAMISGQTQSDWILDTAATDHFCNDQSFFTDFHPMTNSQATIAEGTTEICGIGNINLSINDKNCKVSLPLRNVYFVPGMSRNLISGRLIDDNGYSAFLKNG